MEGMRDSGKARDGRGDARAMMAGALYTHAHSYPSFSPSCHKPPPSHLVGPDEADVAGLDAHDAADLLLDGRRGAGGLMEGDEESLVLALDADVAATAGAAVCLTGEKEAGGVCVSRTCERFAMPSLLVHRQACATPTRRTHHACPQTRVTTYLFDMAAGSFVGGGCPCSVEGLLGYLITSEEERRAMRAPPPDGIEAAAACRRPWADYLYVVYVWKCGCEAYTAEKRRPAMPIRRASPTCMRIETASERSVM